MHRTHSRQRLLQNVAAEGLIQLFDCMPDVSFFMKDRECRFIALNRLGCEFCGVASERDAIGKTDRDFFPSNRAKDYMADDHAVMDSGLPIIDRLEPAPEGEGSPHLVVTNKIPLRDRSGKIIGVVGFSRRVEGLRDSSGSFKKLSKVMATLHQRHAEPLEVEDLAKMAGMSKSQFDRVFRKAFGTSPHHYLMRVRVENACRLLAETSETIAAIAQQCGFYDHAHFTRTFVSEKGLPPSRFRRERLAHHRPGSSTEF